MVTPITRDDLARKIEDETDPSWKAVLEDTLAYVDSQALERG